MKLEQQLKSFKQEVRSYPMRISEIEGLISSKKKWIKDKKEKEIFVTECRHFLKDYIKNYLINP